MTDHGSNRRQRRRVLSARFNDQEAAAVRSMAEKRGQSVGTLLRSTLLGIPVPPRSVRRPNVDTQAVAKVLTMAAQIHAEAGKEGSNLNQLTHVLNAGRPPERVMNLLEVCLQNVQDIQGDMKEIRTACLRALGQEPNRKIED